VVVVVPVHPPPTGEEGEPDPELDPYPDHWVGDETPYPELADPE